MRAKGSEIELGHQQGCNRFREWVREWTVMLQVQGVDGRVGSGVTGSESGLSAGEEKTGLGFKSHKCH